MTSFWGEQNFCPVGAIFDWWCLSPYRTVLPVGLEPAAALAQFVDTFFQLAIIGGFCAASFGPGGSSRATRHVRRCRRSFNQDGQQGLVHGAADHGVGSDYRRSSCNRAVDGNGYVADAAVDDGVRCCGAAAATPA